MKCCSSQLESVAHWNILLNAPFEKDRVEQNRCTRFFNKPAKFGDAIAVAVLGQFELPLILAQQVTFFTLSLTHPVTEGTLLIDIQSCLLYTSDAADE